MPKKGPRFLNQVPTFNPQTLNPYSTPKDPHQGTFESPVPTLLGPRVGPYSLFLGSGSLIGPFKPQRAPFLFLGYS